MSGLLGYDFQNTAEQSPITFSPNVELAFSISCNPVIEEKLSEDHINHLRESCISNEIMKEAMVCSVPKGVLHKQSGICLVYLSLTGRVIGYRYRLDEPIIIDNKPQKYHQPPGSHLVCYFLEKDIHKILDPNFILIIVEGEKKLLSLASHIDRSKFVIIAIPGCWNFLSPRKERETKNGTIKVLADVFQQIPLQGRNILLIPDNDFFFKFLVYSAYTKLIFLLNEKGAKVGLIDLRISNEDEDEDENEK